MKGYLAVVLAAALAFAMPATAQQAEQGQPSNCSEVAAKPISMSGKVGAGGEIFDADKNAGSWAVSDPEILRESVGRRVRIHARVNACKHELQVVAVQSVPTAGARLEDTAFRR